MPDIERAALQAAIRDAIESGNGDLVAKFQAMYRQLSSSNPYHGGVSVSDPARSIGGYGATFDSTATAPTTSGELVAYRFAASAFDAWLRGVRFDARTVAVKWSHGGDGLPGTFGFVTSASVDEIGVRVTCQLEDSPASRLLLDAADNGRLGFSCHGIPTRDRDTGETVKGKPLYIIEASSIEEVSLCLRETGADQASVIDTVAGRPARYTQREAEHVAREAFRKIFGSDRTATGRRGNPFHGFG